MKTSKAKLIKHPFTPGPWRVQSDPLLAKLHPLHENRYVTTDNEMETWRSCHAEGHGDDSAGFVNNQGAIICTMPDSTNQKANAQLIALAPDMRQCVELLTSVVEDMLPKIGSIVLQDYGKLNQALILSERIRKLVPMPETNNQT